MFLKKNIMTEKYNRKLKDIASAYIKVETETDCNIL